MAWNECLKLKIVHLCVWHQQRKNWVKNCTVSQSCSCFLFAYITHCSLPRAKHVHTTALSSNRMQL